MCVEHSNERPEGVRVSKVCGCRGLVGIEGVVEGVGVATLRVHVHERMHSCVLRSGVRCYIINSQMGGTHLVISSISGTERGEVRGVFRTDSGPCHVTHVRLLMRRADDSQAD